MSAHDASWLWMWMSVSEMCVGGDITWIIGFEGGLPFLCRRQRLYSQQVSDEEERRRRMGYRFGLLRNAHALRRHLWNALQDEG